ncbi:trehalose-phosphatase [Modestobacter sp. I12A-02628]|uniref:Trehalose 6-phosphate phosphatase n=1 Tax=Goekera deserti TaxID=2497753 RepID=A0A7K3WJP8_9ACTN|nr:trehalose-phosphatase [Goekera deserti]MPR00415.1 trehalose-phosphatase [Goekera deserti]NDI50381.1 trehalose-phosphatase [Goekera deserti]NEL56674.1 trehalose-phosphatase [Goekera deserti]
MTAPDATLEEALVAFAAQRPLLVASDYDGVLARLRNDPSTAVPETGIGNVLAGLAAVDGVTVALVSGRGVADLRRTSGLIGPYRWVGSHGAEFDGPVPGELAARRDQLATRLSPLVAAVRGARLEVKPASVAVHVRQVTDAEAAASLLAQVADCLDPTLTAKPGKQVLEVAVTDADKGSALARLREELGVAAALYLGDDVTDEDGFRALQPGDVTIKVGDGETVAEHRIPEIEGVRPALERLLAALT